MTMEINWVAVVVAMVGAMATGFIWYSPALFVKPWMREQLSWLAQTRSASLQGYRAYWKMKPITQKCRMLTTPMVTAKLVTVFVKY